MKDAGEVIASFGVMDGLSGKQRMDNRLQSIEEQLIRHRIEKRMAGRRDLLLHLLVYVAVAVIARVNLYWYDLKDILMLGGLWTIPLVLHGLRYWYRCGPGAASRADEIERAIDEQLKHSALDEDEEIRIEERVDKRITARRVIVAHGMAAAMVFALVVMEVLPDPNVYDMYHVYRVAIALIIAFGLHFLRFFFVHGRTPEGRALKIERAVEREWHRSRQRNLERRSQYEAAADDDLRNMLALGESGGRRLQLNAEGEFAEPLDERGLNRQAALDLDMERRG